MDVTEMKSAAELNVQTPPPFVPSQSGAVAPTADEEAQLRALFSQHRDEGLEALDTVVPVGNANQPPIPQIPIPQKFQKPDGTVDEDKLKASSEQIQKAVETKEAQVKSIEEMLAEYKANEKKLHELSQGKADLSRQAASLPPIVPQGDPGLDALHQQIMNDYRNDPVGTTIRLNQAIVQKELAPLLERARQDDEVRRDSGMRDGLAKLAESDPRVLNNQYYQQILQVLNEEPALKQTRNPFKSAWNEVKDRLRLGEPVQGQAQLSNPSPTLGRGSPPSVSTLPGPQTPQTLRDQSQNLNPYSAEGLEFERKLREATNGLWQ